MRDGRLRPVSEPEPWTGDTIRTHPNLLVAIPALDEAATIESVVRGVPEAIPKVGSIEVLVVDDGSRDGTAGEARRAGATVLSHPQNLGLGLAFRSAVEFAIERDADLLVTLDADGQFDAADIPKVLEPVLSGTADFATVTRFADPRLTPRMPLARRWGNLLMNHIVSRLAERRFTDVSCGMRCYSRAALLRLFLVGQFTYTQETILILSFKGLRIGEVPVRVRGTRPVGTSRMAPSLIRYGYRSAKIIARCYRDYRPIRFFGGLGLLGLVGVVFLAGFVLSHYAATGQFTPHKWAALTASGLALFSAFMFHLGILGDMMTRQRLYLEEILYNQRSEPRSMVR